MKHPTHAEPYAMNDIEYTIRENHVDGVLEWFWLQACPDRDPTALVMPRANYYHATAVTDEDAETITGMWMPAAMDRLREMVHESEGVTT